MTSYSSRVSADVWVKAGEVAKRMGLPNERTAIEAVFRVFADAYANGITPAQPAAPVAAAALTSAEPMPIDCTAALDGLLSA